MPDALKKEDYKYTCKDYITWPDDERWELIDGTAYNMSPAPSREHQEIVVELVTIFNSFLRDKSCQTYVAPFDVRLPDKNQNEEDIDTIVQPDISVICDKKKLDKKGCKGAPDLIIEVTSPSTAGKDMREKYFLYQKHKVKEYWIVHPNEQVVTVFILQKNGQYNKQTVYTVEDSITVTIFDLTIDLATVFPDNNETE